MMRHLSKSPGIGGRIKSSPEDFLVEEIGQDGTVFALNSFIHHPDSPGGYTHFILQKRGWATSGAISEIAKKLRLSERNFNIAGSKDKTAITTGLASVRGDLKKALQSLSIRDISILGAWIANDRVHLGDLLGNRFTITVRDADNDPKKIETIASELNNRIPNFFGEQRFGSTRKNTHLIGQSLLAGKTEKALFMFLCDSEGENNEEARLARKELSDTRDFSRALKYFPKHLRLERSLIAFLEKNPDRYSEAFRRLPRNILLLFIHAFQSFLFNDLLSERISEGELELEEGEYFCGETLGFPDIKKMDCEGWIAGKLIGYTTPINPREKALLERLGVEKDAFRLKNLPEIASKGSYRTILAPLKDFSFENTTFRFSLQSGSYATVAMREFMDKKH